MYSIQQRRRHHPGPTGCRGIHAAAAFATLAAEDRVGYTTGHDGPAGAGGAGFGGDLSVARLLEDLSETLGQLAGLPLAGGLGDEQLLDAHATLTSLLARVHRERLRALAEIDERGAYHHAGVRSASSLLERCHQHTPYEALGYARTALELPDLPDTDAALARGELNYEQAAVVAKAWRKLRLDRERWDAEAKKQKQQQNSTDDGDEDGDSEGGGHGDGAGADPDDTSGGAGGAGEGAGTDAGAGDADDAGGNAGSEDTGAAGSGAGAGSAGAGGSTGGGEPDDDDEGARRERARQARERARRKLDEMAAGRGGQVSSRRLAGELEDWQGANDPRRLAERDRLAHASRSLWLTPTGADGLATLKGRLPAAQAAKLRTALASASRRTSKGDERSADQRRADALETVVDTALGQGTLPAVKGRPPQLLLITKLAQLTGEDPTPPTLDGAGPISSETARMLACRVDAAVIATGGRHDDILDVGRRHRDPTLAQIDALSARDRHCVGCRAPIAQCESHHVQHWADGGATDLANLVLLCANCHFHLHHHGWRITPTPPGERTDADPSPYQLTRPPNRHHRRGGGDGSRSSGDPPGTDPPGRAPGRPPDDERPPPPDPPDDDHPPPAGPTQPTLDL